MCSGNKENRDILCIKIINIVLYVSKPLLNEHDINKNS